MEMELQEGVTEARIALAEAVETRAELERMVSQAEKAHIAAVRAIADRREGLARLSGQVEALRSKTNATAEEIERLSVTVVEASERVEWASMELAEAREITGTEDEGDHGLDERHRQAVQANDAAKQRVEELVKAERTAERDIASWRARVDALSLGLTRKDGAGALLASGVPGLLGSVAALLTVEPGYEVALAAALGPIADAVAVSSGDGALQALKLLKEKDAGRAGVLIGSHGSTVDTSQWGYLPHGARWAIDVVHAPEALRPALARALDRLAVVEDLDTARRGSTCSAVHGHRAR